ncbi:MAG: type IV secretory system conjugative DNA transfer family protein, partial [Granulosicoccaceae bacterium]
RGGVKLGTAAGKAAAQPIIDGRIRENYGEDGLTRYKQARRSGASHEAALQALEAWVARQNALQNIPPIYGESRFATLQELKDKGHILTHSRRATPPPGVTWLGELMNANDLSKPIYTGDTPFVVWDDVGSMVTVAPTRSGKGTRLIVPTLLFFQGAAIVIDPKGELFELTGRHRAQKGPIYRLDPFGETTNAFNPLDYVKTPTDALQLAKTLYQSKATGDGAHFDELALSFLRALILFVKTLDPQHQTIAKVRAFTRKLSKRSDSEGTSLLSDMATCGNGVIEAAAEDVLEGGNRAITNLRQSFAAQLGVWDEPGMCAVTARSDFAFEDLKHMEATVYVTIPLDQMTHCGPLVRTLVNVALKGLTRELGEIKPPVLLLLDEFLSFGKMDELVDGLTYLAGYGVRPWLILQDVDRAREVYGDKVKSLMTQAAVRTYFGTSDIETCEAISKELGMTTIAVPKTGGSGSAQADQVSYGSSNSVDYVGKPLWTPDQVRANLDFEENGVRCGLHFIRGMQYPFCTGLRPWYDSAEIKALVNGELVIPPRAIIPMLKAGATSFQVERNNITHTFNGYILDDFALASINHPDGDGIDVFHLASNTFLGTMPWYWQAIDLIVSCQEFRENHGRLPSGNQLKHLRDWILVEDIWFSIPIEHGALRRQLAPLK